MIQDLEATAVEACKIGGEYLRAVFEAEINETQYHETDVKSSADTGSEQRMLDVITHEFPDHEIYAEESGLHESDSPYHWIVDPLDGTNNFVAGLPSFATAIAVLKDGECILGVTYIPLLDDLYVARRDGGVRYNNNQVQANSTVSLDRGTIVFVIGHDVKQHPNRATTADAISRAVESQCKRRLESWSPTVHWGLLARGRLEGIVSYYPDREEQVSGELFATESGMTSTNGEGWYVAAANNAATESLASTVEGAIGK